MYKKIFNIALVAFLLILTSCRREDSYFVEGNLRGINSGTVHLLKSDEYGEFQAVDSANVYGGRFHFRGHVDFPTMYYIQIGKGRPIDIFIENRKMTVRGSVLIPDEIKVTGSKSYNEYLYLQKKSDYYHSMKNSTFIELTNARKQNDKKRIKSIEDQYNSYSDSILETTQQFVSKNPASVGAAYFVCTLVPDFDICRLEEIIKSFDPSIQESEYIHYLNDELILSQNLVLGSQAEDFCLPSSNGDSVSLSDFNGKYLLIEFWASWCKNSEIRNRNMKKIYEKYHDLGLEMLSISLDREENKWKEALVRDSMPWTQASDLLYWESPVSKYYRVQRIPCSFLIDPDKKVILINPRKNVLDSRLRVIFGK